MEIRLEDHLRSVSSPANLRINDQCREINALVGRKTAALFGAVPGLKSSTPQGAFYLYVDFNEQREQLFKLGLKSCAEFARHLLQVEHTALLPGESLLLPEADFSTRCSFVDYDGEQVLERWRAAPPRTAEEQELFFRENCPLIVDGVKYIGRYVEQVRAGKKPAHMM